MAFRSQYRGANYKGLVLYLVKCIAAASAVYSFSNFFQYSDIVWCLISALLVLSPEAKEALPLAVARIEANFVGGFCILLVLLLRGVPHLLILSIAYTLTIALCFLLNLMPVSRSALVAVTIIGFAPVAEPHLWDKPLERVLSVTAGCLVGLFITLLFHRRIPGSRIKRIDDQGMKYHEGQE